MRHDRQHDLDAGTPLRHHPSPPSAPAPGPIAGSVAAGLLPRYSHDQVARYLETGFWSDFSEEPRKFDMSAAGPGANAGVLLYNVADLTSQGAALAEQALAIYERILGIDFVRTTSMGASADLIFFDGGDGAYTETYLGQSASTIGFATVNISKDCLAEYGASIGSYSFQTYLHEIGHALGLGHAGPYNHTANFVLDGRDPDFGNNSNIYRNDSWQKSMMSYFSQTENTTTDASYAFLLGPTVADWIALEAMYGPSRGAFAGNTVWGFNTNIADTAFASLAAYADEAAFTIIDRGGVDTIDLSGFAADQSIDLDPESLSSVGGLRGNMTIARGAIIENAVGGAGDDRLSGNGADNALSGGGGADRLLGRAGRDTLNGGKGADIMKGGAGDDAYHVDAAGDRVVETGLGGYDAVYARGGFTLGLDVERLVLTGSSAANGIGNAQANALWGNAQSNALRGLSGADTLRGGLGADTLVGGAGADVFQFLAAAESAAAARDTLQAGDGAAAFQGAGSGDGDRFDLSSIDADQTRAGLQDFAFGGQTGKGRLWAREADGLTLIRGNVDADRLPEFELAVADGAVLASAYATADFLV